MWWVLLFRFWIEKSHFKRNTKSKWSGKKVNLRKQFWYGVSGLKISRRKPLPALLVSWGWMFLSLSWFLPVWVVRPFFCLMIGRSTVAGNYKYKCFCTNDWNKPKGTVFWMGFYADISWESRCCSEIKVWSHLCQIFVVFEVPTQPLVKGMSGNS